MPNTNYINLQNPSFKPKSKFIKCYSLAHCHKKGTYRSAVLFFFHIAKWCDTFMFERASRNNLRISGPSDLNRISYVILSPTCYTSVSCNNNFINI